VLAQETARPAARSIHPWRCRLFDAVGGSDWRFTAPSFTAANRGAIRQGLAFQVAASAQDDPAARALLVRDRNCPGRTGAAHAAPLWTAPGAAGGRSLLLSPLLEQGNAQPYQLALNLQVTPAWQPM